MKFEYFQVYKDRVYDNSGVVPKDTGNDQYGLVTAILVDTPAIANLIIECTGAKLIWDERSKSIKPDSEYSVTRKFPLVFICHQIAVNELLIKVEICGRFHADLAVFKKWLDVGVCTSIEDASSALTALEDLFVKNNLKKVPLGKSFDFSSIVSSYEFERLFDGM